MVRPLKVPTEEIILVLSGALKVSLQEAEYVLKEGDSIYFEGAQLTGLSCAGDEKAEWVSMITPPSNGILTPRRIMLDCVIKGGTVVTASGLQQPVPAIVFGILGETIVQIAPHLTAGSYRHRQYIDARGMLVIPSVPTVGGVDPHVHFEIRFLPSPAGQFTTSDTWETASKAAALGGATTVIDFVEPAYPGQPLLEALDERQRQANASSAIDYGLHMTLCAADETTLRDIPTIIASGLPSFKLYTTYEGFRLPVPTVDDESLLLAFQAIARAGGLAMVHAESDAILRFAARQLAESGRLGLEAFADSRPALAEVEAVQRVLALARCTGVPLYLAHLSTQASVEALARARSSGQLAWGETCPQYLLLDQSRLQTSGLAGAKFTCCPPLRPPADLQGLWAALAAHSLDAIGSDHCAFNHAGQKDSTGGKFMGIPAGLPGVELRLALIYTYGVVPGLITPAQWVDLCCSAPARLFGLSQRKGHLCVGADADLVLFDPNRQVTITKSILHENVDYTPYEGLSLSGMVDTTILRGQVLVRGGQWVETPRIGKFIPGQPGQFTQNSYSARNSYSAPLSRRAGEGPGVRVLP